MGLMTSLQRLLTGGGLVGVKDLVEVFTANAEAASQRGDDLQADVLRQFAAEFHQRSNRTRWDSFVDGLNRLPRPLLALAVPSPLVLTPLYPLRMGEAYTAWALIPSWYGYLIVTVISFFFIGRNQAKNLDFQRDAAGVFASTQAFLSTRRELRALNGEAEAGSAAPAAQAAPELLEIDDNPALDAWRASMAN
jgi:hypothetical protein